MSFSKRINKQIIFTIKKQKNYEKLVFAVIAAVAMVSVSNVFAGNRMVSVAGSEPVDTVAPADTTATPVEAPAATVDSTVAK